ncbi:CoA pyrophosphatase [Maribacter sp. PR1]|uniref:CoA pyrophosphatase n=1 Tax=Maribacter cobaltidurans TaxID=1178778 RepID=A0ABU7IXY3_9FLAO|nr:MULTISPECIES: CoA pyrophosphatase [Maribacter]MDC6389996.1 CoA pyrophosphatase [Maribacter sp. PR1]MEE1977386.1 CoA pyrophosphatase [Maribacter cobaltidurans]
MDFSIFEQRISKIKDLPLPGEISHYKMAPDFRIKELREGKIVNKNPRKAAVMALFYPGLDNRTHLLCILRKTYEGVHSNQVALPGGKAEKEDGSLKITALRETYEEVGVNPKDVEVLRTISEVYIPPSNFEVQPFIGLYQKPKPFKIQESEVASLLEISLVDFLEDMNLTTKKLSTSYAKEVSVPAFKLNDYIIWGATAMMLSEIKDLLKQVL